MARRSSFTSRSSSLSRWASLLVSPGRWPSSRSTCRIHRRSVSFVIPSFGAMALIAAHWDGYCPACSRTRRIARSRTSGEKSPRFGLPIIPNLPQVGVSGKPGAVQLDYDPLSEIPAVPGTIVKPLRSYVGSQMIYGTLEVDGVLQVRAVKSWAAVGEPIQRIGATTGWQTGTVVQTCQNWSIPGSNGFVRLLCQDEGTTFSEPGDSGSPVFQSFDLETGGMGIIFIGINWGSYSSDASNFHSHFDGMELDLGRICPWYGC